MNPSTTSPRVIDGPLAEGTVGWASDGGTAIDLGDAPNDGSSLVNVTLFRGRDPTQPLDQTRAQGQQVRCRLGTRVFAVPPYGARVLVAIPEPWGLVPGGPIIIDVIDNSMWTRFGNAEAGDVVIASLSGVARLVLKANGNIALATTSDGTTAGKSVFLSVGPAGLAFASPWVTLQADKIGFRVKTAWGSALKVYGVGGIPGVPAALRSVVKLTAAFIKNDSSQVLNGPDLPGTQFVPTVAALDPGGAPLLAALLAALPPYLQAVQAVLTPLGGNPTTTGVTPAQILALEAAAQPLSAALATTGGIMTTTSVKVALPVP